MGKRGLEEKMARATTRLAQLRAQQLLREMREAKRAKAQIQAEERRQRWELGGAVIAAGFAQWSVPEVVGLLLFAHDHIGASPTMRIGVRQRGEAHLGVTRPAAATGPPEAPSST